ncbi:YjcG family protein [Psychrobacillus psychrodurans]|uniref:YjcG family protein n=1 Tax=Psychrobacillus TaxID=1221880 RepID=UPI0008E34FD1|nr:YjcG family protein [Psychrobacillus psychrodurans]MCK1996374.1 YjcG family protein [Psychrobacillus psychrodurans]MCZ8539326.1 YjcG family protein [Psychrobacillus psychrodurans]SFM36544.1 2'-5' RNA ligase [Psychrobacillus psychrodurans]
MKYGIVAFPSKKVQDFANSYRKRYDPHYALITPHMTVKGVFEADENEIKSIAEKVSEVVKNHKPFTLKTEKVSSFAPVTNAIYFNVQPTAELVKLHNDLNAIQYNDEESYSFVPHITIAQKLSASEHDDILPQLKMIGAEFEEEIDRLHLLYQLEDGSWTVYETFRLSGAE